MAFVQFSRVSLSFADRDILKDVSLRLYSADSNAGNTGTSNAVSRGSRSCLCGANGSGKTTLLKIIAGFMNADSGDRAVQKNTRVSYLPQSGIVHHGRSLRDETETAFEFAHNLIERLDKTGAKLENAKSDNSATQALLVEHHSLQEDIEKTGYYNREKEITSVLSGLGFSANDINRDCKEFSGGWQMRIALAKILLEKPDILLLDEPTNYLDIEARVWLEKWLNDFEGGYLLVSHDRYFLDTCVNEVYEIFNGALTRYAGNYSSYEKTRQIEIEGLVKKYNEQQEEIEKTEALIRRFRYKASKAAFAQELIKRLEKMEKIVIPESFKKININFPPPPHSGKIALTLSGIGKNYGKRKVLSSFDLCLDSGERLVVAGPNGAGKTTLLRIIAGADSDFTGEVKLGAGIAAGYFSQDAAEALNTQQSVIEFMEEEAPFALIPKLRDMLGAFLFRGDDVHKSVSVLSGGEKSRLALLKMFLKPMNLLILDEPTNHLDLYSKDILLDALKKFSGTIIFVSHDRSFMEELSTKTLELTPGEEASPANAKLFYGNYAYYLDRLNRVQPDRTSEPAGSGSKISAIETGVYQAKLPIAQQGDISFNNKRVIDKQKQAALRKLEKQETEILLILDDLEKKKTYYEIELSLPDVYSDGKKTKEVKHKLKEIASQIEIKTHEWEEISKKIGESNV